MDILRTNPSCEKNQSILLFSGNFRIPTSILFLFTKEVSFLVAQNWEMPWQPKMDSKPILPPCTEPHTRQMASCLSLGIGTGNLLETNTSVTRPFEAKTHFYILEDIYIHILHMYTVYIYSIYTFSFKYYTLIVSSNELLLCYAISISLDTYFVSLSVPTPRV